MSLASMFDRWGTDKATNGCADLYEPDSPLARSQRRSASGLLPRSKPTQRPSGPLTLSGLNWAHRSGPARNQVS